VLGHGASLRAETRIPGGDVNPYLAFETLVAMRDQLPEKIDEKTIPAETGVVGRAVSFTKGCFTGQELVARIDPQLGVGLDEALREHRPDVVVHESANAGAGIAAPVLPPGAGHDAGVLAAARPLGGAMPDKEDLARHARSIVAGVAGPAPLARSSNRRRLAAASLAVVSSVSSSSPTRTETMGVCPPITVRPMPSRPATPAEAATVETRTETFNRFMKPRFRG